ncbi:MAG: YlmC/YmxH family sporulation protein [Oscillospiraceae bacterium]|nr:YlmC/YmxH family sporulation protein [Oscillospiraceae bacterium]
MECRIGDIRHKEVINVEDGNKLGSIGDLEIDIKSGKILAIVVYGRFGFLGFFGRQDDTVIPWGKIKIIGEDIILVSHEVTLKRKKRNKFIKGIFGDWD